MFRPGDRAATRVTQVDTPYLDALRAHAARTPRRLHLPGHKGGAAADARLVAALGTSALALDIPALTWGIDLGSQPTPFDEAQRLAAEAWGARRTWFLVNGASQGNQVALLALAHLGHQVVVQRNAHSSTVDGLVLAGLEPRFVAPELDPELHVAHCVTPEALDRALADAPDAVGATVVSPTYFGAVADVAGLAEVAHAHGVPLVVDESWGAHLAFHRDLPCHALALGADLVVSSIHKIVGSLTQSSLVHLGHGDLLDEELIDRCVTLVASTSPNALLYASLDSARHAAAVYGTERLSETLQALETTRAGLREIPGVDVIDARLIRAPSVLEYDPLRVVIDLRGTGRVGYELAHLLREQEDIHLELAAENVLVAVFGMAEGLHAQTAGEHLVAALRRALTSAPSSEGRAARDTPFASPPPWGELVLTPRDAFLGEHEVVPVDSALGRVSAESLAVYPPGIPNVLPGERLTAETLNYIRQTLDHGGLLRGASDARLRTVRVVAQRAA